MIYWRDSAVPAFANSVFGPALKATKIFVLMKATLICKMAKEDFKKPLVTVVVTKKSRSIIASVIANKRREEKRTKIKRDRTHTEINMIIMTRRNLIKKMMMNGENLIRRKMIKNVKERSQT